MDKKVSFDYFFWRISIGAWVNIILFTIGKRNEWGLETLAMAMVVPLVYSVVITWEGFRHDKFGDDMPFVIRILSVPIINIIFAGLLPFSIFYFADKVIAKISSRF